MEEVNRLRVCLRCLASNHPYKSCRVTCNYCRRPHNTLLHVESNHSTFLNIESNRIVESSESKGSELGTSNKSSSSAMTQTSLLSQVTTYPNEHENGLLPSVIVNIFDQAGQSHPVYAILDSGSTVNVCSERLVTLIGARKCDSRIEIGAIGATSTSSSKR